MQENTQENIQLLYGTGNTAKLAVIKKYLKGLNEVELPGLKDMGFPWQEPEADGSGFVRFFEEALQAHRERKAGE